MRKEGDGAVLVCPFKSHYIHLEVSHWDGLDFYEVVAIINDQGNIGILNTSESQGSRHRVLGGCADIVLTPNLFQVVSYLIIELDDVVIPAQELIAQGVHNHELGSFIEVVHDSLLQR